MRRFFVFGVWGVAAIDLARRDRAAPIAYSPHPTAATTTFTDTFYTVLLRKSGKWPDFADESAGREMRRIFVFGVWSVAAIDLARRGRAAHLNCPPSLLPAAATTTTTTFTYPYILL